MLSGPATQSLECLVDSYSELVASVNDACDTALTVATVGGAVVNVNVPGVYVVTYNATDSSGNAAAQMTRTVTVSDTIKPVITLNGPATQTLECHVDSYSELGASVNDACDTALTVATVGGAVVNVNVPGVYVVTYNATDASGNAAVEVTRTVTVSDTIKPVITLNGPATQTLECHVDSYSELGASVNDACDTALTVATVGGAVVNVNVPGVYVVTYNATDASGNAAVEVTRTVTVSDTIKPVITLNGPATQTLECHVDSYSERGASVNDACDTALTVATVGGAVVNVNVPGVYVVT